MSSERTEGWWWYDRHQTDEWAPVLVFTDANGCWHIRHHQDGEEPFDLESQGVWGEVIERPGGMPVTPEPAVSRSEVYEINGRRIRRKIVDDLVVSILGGVGGYVMAGRAEAEAERGRSWIVSLHPERSGLNRELVPDSQIALYLSKVRALYVDGGS